MHKPLERIVCPQAPPVFLGKSVAGERLFISLFDRAGCPGEHQGDEPRQDGFGPFPRSPRMFSDMGSSNSARSCASHGDRILACPATRPRGSMPGVHAEAAAPPVIRAIEARPGICACFLRRFILPQRCGRTGSGNAALAGARAPPPCGFEPSAASPHEAESRRTCNTRAQGAWLRRRNGC